MPLNLMSLMYYLLQVASIISGGIPVSQDILCLGGPGLKSIFLRLQGQGSGLLLLIFTNFHLFFTHINLFFTHFSSMVSSDLLYPLVT